GRFENPCADRIADGHREPERETENLEERTRGHVAKRWITESNGATHCRTARQPNGGKRLTARKAGLRETPNRAKSRTAQTPNFAEAELRQEPTSAKSQTARIDASLAAAVRF